MTTTDDLLDMSVDDQKDELENLDREQLEELRDREERSTAIDNIDREIESKFEDRPEDKIPMDADEHSQGESMDADDSSVEVKKSDSRIEELEAKVDYIISRCKTTSEEGFEDYHEN